MKNVPLKTLLLLLLLLSVAKLNAQVTIGADAAPQPFSVLELYAKYKTDPVDTYGGLRLPQLDTVQRNALSRTYGVDPAFFGLTIYNTNNNCLEYWNSTKWVSLCLGTADISLEGDNCTYDPSTPIPDGAEPCTYTPVEVPPCVVQNGHPYQVYLVTGFAYASVQVVDAFTSSFTVSFEENNSVYPRIAVVRVTSNCTGEFKDFPFIQPGGTCPGGNNFTVSFNTNPQTLCGSNGAIIAYIPIPEDGMNYIWALNGGVVHTGNYMEIRRSGTYMVYAGLLGCEPSFGPFQININPGGTSPSAPFVIANNYAMLCPSGSVTLTAFNVTNPVQWFQNGILYNGTYSDGTAGPPSANPLVVSGASAAGEWFAVQVAGNCGSRMSNIITLIDRIGDAIELPVPIFTINGALYNNMPPPVVCKGGSVELVIVNHSAFPAGTRYEWFFNSLSIGSTQDSMISIVDRSENFLIISVQASNNFGGCPSTAATAQLPVTHIAPFSTTINGGASMEPICGSDPATLIATDASQPLYAWYKNNNGVFTTGLSYETMPSDTFRYDATSIGFYSVRYRDINGCWSPLSPAIRVIQSFNIALEWKNKPSASPAGINSERSFSVLASPEPDSYVWRSLDLTRAIITSQQRDIASIRYVGLCPPTVIIEVEATNPCGPVSVRDTVCVQDICAAVTGVRLNRLGQINGQGNTTYSFVATVSPSTAELPITYNWYRNNVVVQGPLALSPYPTVSLASYDFTTPAATGVEQRFDIYVVATNCGTPPPPATVASPVTTIIVPPTCTEDLSGTYRIGGKICYDVNRTPGTDANGCMPLGARVDDFSNGTKLTFDYTFSGPTPNTIRGWKVIDLNNVLDATTPIVQNPVNPRMATIKFRSDINSWATGRTKDNPMTVTIVAQFCPSASSSCSPCYEARLVVNVQDCSCGCVVNSTLTQAPYNGKITFMCYNLGVAESTKSISVAQQMAYVPTSIRDSTVYGGWFQWGRLMDGHQTRYIVGGAAGNAVSGPVPVASFDPITGQLAPPYRGRFIARPDNTNWFASNYTNLWNAGTETNPIKSSSDPCPPGWRIPTQTEWGSIYRGGTTSGTFAASTVNTFSWHSTGTPGLKVSPDGGTTVTLFLPRAHYRMTDGTNGLATVVCNYHSSTAFGSVFLYRFQARDNNVNPALTTNSARAYGMSIRCVAE